MWWLTMTLKLFEELKDWVLNRWDFSYKYLNTFDKCLKMYETVTDSQLKKESARSNMKVFIRNVSLWLQELLEWRLTQLKDIVKKILIYAAIFSVILWMAIILYGSFYYSYMPKVSFAKPVHLEFSVCDDGVSMCSFPTANISFIKDRQDEVFARGQSYTFLLNIDLPESPVNKDLGMFMIKLQMYNHKGEVVKSVSRSLTSGHRLNSLMKFSFAPKNGILMDQRWKILGFKFFLQPNLRYLEGISFGTQIFPKMKTLGHHTATAWGSVTDRIILLPNLYKNTHAIMHFRSELLRVIDTFVFLPLLLFGFQEQQQSLTVELFSNYVDDAYNPAVGAIVTVNSLKVQVYNSELKIHANFTGFRYILFNWPVLSAVIGISCNFVLLSFITLLSWYKFGSRGDPQEQENYQPGNRIPSLEERRRVVQARLDRERIGEVRSRRHLEETETLGCRGSESDTSETDLNISNKEMSIPECNTKIRRRITTTQH